MSKSEKGSNKRCGDQLVIGGVPTLASEHTWVLRDGAAVALRSRHQLSDVPELVLVTPAGVIPTPEHLAPGADLPSEWWVGHTSADLARAGTSRRRPGLAAATAAGSAHLSGRLSVRASLDLRVDVATATGLSDLSLAVRAHGGRALVVGGAVRDVVAASLGRAVTTKDVDIEVYGLDPVVLRELIGARWSVDDVGASFAVLKVDVGGSEPLDVSMPRTETATGTGHRDFTVAADPTLSFTAAARRRDFTIGAMGYDPLTGELLDPYGGAADLAAGYLRHVSDAFSEDPLRVLRAARFAARFDLTVAPATVALCRSLRPLASSLSAERIFAEIALTLGQAERPGVALTVLDDLEWIDLFAPVADLRGVAQSPRWHPEGDVFIHTAHALDYWGTHLKTGTDDDLIVGMAVLCHDLGKAPTTTFSDDWHALGHEAAGVPLARAMLTGYLQQGLAGDIAPLIAQHLAPVTFPAQGASPAAYRRLAVKVPRLDLLARVSRADVGGRPPQDPSAALAVIDSFEAAVAAAGVTAGALKRLATGDQLIALGLDPGPRFRGLLDAAYEAQMDGLITTSDEAAKFLSGLVRQS